MDQMLRQLKNEWGFYRQDKIPVVFLKVQDMLTINAFNSKKL